MLDLRYILFNFNFNSFCSILNRFNVFQGVGLIAAVGESVKNLEVGTPAAVMTFGAYSEYMIV